MTWICAALLCVLLVEIALRLPFLQPMKAFRDTLAKAGKTMGAKAVSDHWKEKAMGAYARITFLASLQLFGLLVVLFGSAAIVVLAVNKAVPGFTDFMTGWQGLVFTGIFATVYAWARTQRRARHTAS